jgi:hypothetical protein
MCGTSYLYKTQIPWTGWPMQTPGKDIELLVVICIITLIFMIVYRSVIELLRHQD